jgi:hypothetical protein
MVACDDGTAGVVDLKTAMPSDAHVPLYARQLHSYAWGLERPNSGPSTEVSALGLLCFSPRDFEAQGSRAVLLGDLQWLGVPRDDEGFSGFLREVLRVLEAPKPPAPTEGCPWCASRATA